MSIACGLKHLIYGAGILYGFVETGVNYLMLAVDSIQGFKHVLLAAKFTL